MAVVNATRDPYAFPDVPRLQQARNFLVNIASSIEALSPALYAQAMAQLSVISSRLPPDNISMQTIAERVKRSQDPLEAWIEEADSPENKFFRNDILTEAAQLALEKRKLELAIDIVSKIEIKDEDKNTRLWRGQFLKDVSDSALQAGKPDIALRAEESIEDVLTRTQALKKIAIYYLQTGDAASAEQVLGTALKLATSIAKASDRAAAYLDLAEACQRLNEGKLYEVISLAVKAINSIDAPDTQDKPGSSKRDGYARELSALSWRLTPAFQSLVARNEDDAFYFAEAIQRREMRAAALLGIYMGLPDVPKAQSHKNTE
jgi:tetratricopeptide (TPR) repeat protein